MPAYCARTQALLDLDHGGLEIGDVAPDRTQMLNDQVDAFV
jgi:hypothetical protein